jgi:hypothetical protein
MTLAGSDDEAILAALNKTSFTNELMSRYLLEPSPEVLDSKVINK